MTQNTNLQNHLISVSIQILMCGAHVRCMGKYELGHNTFPLFERSGFMHQ